MKPNAAWLAEFIVCTLWFFLLFWLLGDVPHEWRVLATFAVYYLSILATRVARAVKKIDEIIGD